MNNEMDTLIQYEIQDQLNLAEMVVYDLGSVFNDVPPKLCTRDMRPAPWSSIDSLHMRGQHIARVTVDFICHPFKV
jgi:hypothetical protein